jgi:coenzyme F420-reducing hydrogenase beta subunit
MPINIKNKAECTGCAACVNVCPKECISMSVDSSGFSYPYVNLAECINCELCKNICPLIVNKEKDISNLPSIFAAWSKNEDVRHSSTSGGIFSEIAIAKLRTGGKVVGASYNSKNMVNHKMIQQEKDVALLRQSKYIQSDIGLIYRSVKKELDTGVQIVFAGAPCQIAGLKSYLLKTYTNLLTVDFICRGVNSPKAYQYWLDELEKKFYSRVNNVWFKYKKYGWKASPLCTRISFENGKTYVANAEKNTFMRGYLEGNLYLRPCCSECRFKGEVRESDITLADFWSIPKELDDDHGTSLIMINSKAGKQLFDEIENNIIYYPRNYEEISRGNVCFRESAKLNPKSEEFLGKLGTVKFSILIKEYCPVSIRKSIRIRLSKCKQVVLKLIR